MSDRTTSLVGAPPAIVRENVLQAFHVILGHKLRSGLLILGVAIGVTAILGVVAILLGLGKKIEDDFTAADQPYISISRYDVLSEAPGSENVLARKQITVEAADEVRRYCSAAAHVDFRLSSEQGRLWRLTRGSEKTQAMSIAGTTESFPHIHPFEIESGRYFTKEEVLHRRPVVVLAWGPARDLFPNSDPVGADVRIGPRQYTVVGTIERQKSIVGSMGDNFALIPHTTFHKDLRGRGDEGQVVVSIREGRTLEECSEQIVEVMRRHRRIAPGGENDFALLSSAAFLETVRKVTGAVGLVLVVISSIGLLVGGIGIMNIMLVSVTERTHEVGLRMSLGARRKDILLQFLTEAATLTGLGGVLGVASGLFAAWSVARAFEFPFRISVFWVVLAVLFSAAIGLIFGLYPANRAARMDPIEALRHE